VTQWRPTSGVSANAKRRRLRGAPERMLAIVPMLELSLLRERRKLRPRAARCRVTLSGLATQIASEQKVSTRSVWRWYGKFQKSSYRALANRLRSDKGKRRPASRRGNA
jgi:hypothetical protein